MAKIIEIVGANSSAVQVVVDGIPLPDMKNNLMRDGVHVEPQGPCSLVHLTLVADTVHITKNPPVAGVRHD